MSVTSANHDDYTACAPSSTLLKTELRRLAERLRLPQAAVTGLLDRFDLVELDRSLFRDAGLLPGPHLNSLDALHLAAALRSTRTR